MAYTYRYSINIDLSVEEFDVNKADQLIEKLLTEIGAKLSYMELEETDDPNYFDKEDEL